MRISWGLVRVLCPADAGNKKNDVRLTIVNHLTHFLLPALEGFLMRILSIGALAETVKESIARVDYAVSTHGPEPFGRVAGKRVWTSDQVKEVKKSLATCKKNNRNQAAYA